jgi:glycosyltransferase involved in cell wall biosynthesis
MQSHNYSYEIIFLDDGSTDNSWTIIEGFAQQNPNVRAFVLKKFGKSQACMLVLLKLKVMSLLLWMLQDSPEEIPGLYDMIVNGKYDLVSGWKKETLRFCCC